MYPNYMISNLGRVKSLQHITERIDPWGNLTKFKVGGRILKPYIDPFGYANVTIFIKGFGKHNRAKPKIHRLVAAAFIDNPENKAEVNHLNGVRHDNRLENLEWATRSDNTQHMFRRREQYCNNCGAKL